MAQIRRPGCGSLITLAVIAVVACRCGHRPCGAVGAVPVEAEGGERGGDDPAPAVADRLALGNGNRGSLRRRRWQAGRRGRLLLDLSASGAADEALRVRPEHRGDREVPARPRRCLRRHGHIVEQLGKVQIPVLVEPPAANLNGVYAADRSARAGDREPERGEASRVRHAGPGERDLGFGAAAAQTAHRLPRARPDLLLGDLTHIHRADVHAARAARTSPTRPAARAPTHSSRPSTSSRATLT